MDFYEKDPTVTKAVALALMRQAQSLLAAVNEQHADGHLQMAIDALLQKKPSATAGGAA